MLEYESLMKPNRQVRDIYEHCHLNVTRVKSLGHHELAVTMVTYTKHGYHDDAYKTLLPRFHI